MSELQLDEYFTRPDEMRGGTLQKQNTLMHRQLKSFETTLQKASEYYNPDDLYNLILPTIPPGVHMISFDGLQRIVGQSKQSKGGRTVKSQPSLYLRAFLQDFLQYLDHLQQLKDNFDERIYAVLFEYYYEIVFKDVRTNNQKNDKLNRENLLKVLELPKYAKYRKNFTKEFVDELAADCEELSEVMTSLQILVRKWGRLCKEEDIDVSLFDGESEINLVAYPNCENFEAIIRFVPDILHKSKTAHKLAYDWWCLSEKIHKKLTGQHKPKEAPSKKWLQAKTVVGARTSRQTNKSGNRTPAMAKVVSRTSHYHDHCAPKKEHEWVHPSSNPTKSTKKDAFGYSVQKRPKKVSGIPRRVVNPKNEDKGKTKRIHQMTQTQKRVRDACTSPMVTMEDITAKRDLSGKDGNPQDQHKYSYSDSEFEDDDLEITAEGADIESSRMPERESVFLDRQRESQIQDLDERVAHLTFGIDQKVQQLEQKVQELEGAYRHASGPQRLSAQVERAIMDIESLQRGLREIESEKNNLKSSLGSSRRDAVAEDKLKRDIETLNEKLRNMAGLAKVNTYRQELLSSDMQLVLELRGTFTRYNQEVKGKIGLLERLIQEEQKEQAKLEKEIAEMKKSDNEQTALYLRSVTSSTTTPDSGRVNTSKESLLQREMTNDRNAQHNDEDLGWDRDSLYDSEDDIDDTFENVETRNQGKQQSGETEKDTENGNQVANGRVRKPHQGARQDGTLSPLEEERSHRGSRTSLSASFKKRADSPSPNMYDNKRETPNKLNLDPILKLPKISENSQVVQKS